MKKNLSKFLIAVMLFFTPQLTHAQVVTLGTASQFVLFTTAGPITNSGTNYLTHLTGKVGSNSGSSTGFGNVDGRMHSGDPFTAAATADLAIAYNQLNTAIPTAFPSSALGNGSTFTAGVYSIPSAATLNGTLTLDAQGNPNAVFVFQINGGLSTGANAKVNMINGGLACNVYWKTEGMVSIASGNTIRGTIVAHNAAISMGTLDTLEGRALSMNGAITMNSLTAAIPLGCGSLTLTGPVAPTYGAVSQYAIFSSVGPVTNSGATSYVTGDIGTNLGLTTGYNPLFVNGTIHPVPDGSTAAAAPALSAAYAQLHALPTDIELLYPAIFGYDLVLTPHTYLLNAATALTGTVYLNAQGNSNAVFVIKVNGALSVNSGSVVRLINGAQSRNVYWKVEGAVSLASNTDFNGDLVVNNGAIDVLPGAKLRGRALTTTGAITTSGDSINAPLFPEATITGSSTVCVGSSTPMIGFEPGGVWSVTNTNASITNTGIVTGLVAGLDTVIYAVTNSYGTSRGEKIITIMPSSNAGSISGASSVCVSSSITLTNATPGGVWSTSNPIAATVVNGLVSGVSPGNTIISYTVTNTCGTGSTTKPITVYEVPNVNASGNQVVCNGTATTPVNFTGNVSGTTFNWTNDNSTIGLPNAGAGNIPSFIGLNTTNVASMGNIVVIPSANGCTGASKSFTITVKPSPIVSPVSDQIVCNNTSTNTVNFTGTVSGTTFSWTNNNTSIGLAGSGSGDIPSFTALNSTNAPTVASVIVMPSANGCNGASESFIITVNPTPDVATIPNQVVCNGTSTAPINYMGAVAGTTFSWTNDDNTIGLLSTGAGDIPSFTAINATNTSRTANIVVIPSANGCTGAAKSFTITINPTPALSITADQVLCNGAPTTAVIFTGTTSGSVYTWTNDNTTIGLAGAGIGNIPSFTAFNNTNAPVVATITITPTANSCAGVTRSFTITVNNTPTAPVISLTTPPSVCNMTYFRNFGAATLPPAGINYGWSTINASISDTGNTQQYALVNFKSVGNATVILTSTVINTGCLNTASHSVEVTSNTADVPAIVNYFNKSFVCLQNNEEGYVWGYDDASTLAPTWIKGEMNQDYVNATPDLDANKYWVMVTHNGCVQKTYYNKPQDALMLKNTVSISIYPNPAYEQINVEINTAITEPVRMEVYSTFGKKMYMTDKGTANTMINISSFPPGVYMVICYSGSEKLSAQFIKN